MPLDEKGVFISPWKCLSKVDQVLANAVIWDMNTTPKEKRELFEEKAKEAGLLGDTRLQMSFWEIADEAD